MDRTSRMIEDRWVGLAWTRERCGWWWMAGVLLLAGRTVSADLLLVEQGRPCSTIVVGAEATEREKLAGEELQTYLRRISGATVPVVSDAEPVPGTRILIGRNAVSEALALDTRDLGWDGYLIQVVGTDLVLRGQTDQGTLNAVYALLQEYLGVRWYMPGELGEDILPQETIRLPNISARRSPDFLYVYGLRWVPYLNNRDWERRNRAAPSPPGYHFEQGWAMRYLPFSEQNQSQHPEWFAVNPEGERTWQLCTTNPEVIAIAVREAEKFFREHPDAMTYGLAPDDGGPETFCQCQRCRALDAQLGVTDGTITDRLMVFFNQVAEALKARDPERYRGKYLGFLAYQNYTKPPQTVVPDEMVLVEVVFPFWDRCYVHELDHPHCPPNAEFMEWLRGWAKLCRHFGMYVFYGNCEFVTPFPVLHVIPNHFRILKGLGGEALVIESPQHWATLGLNYHLASQLIWDVHRDVEAIWNDFYPRFYGPAAEPMRRYWERLEKAMIESGSCGGNGWIGLYTPELAEELRRYMDQALQAVAEAPDGEAAQEKVRGRVQLARKGFQYLDLWVQMRTAAQAGDGAGVKAKADAAVQLIESTRGQEPQAFWHDRAIAKTRERAREMGSPEEPTSTAVFSPGEDGYPTYRIPALIVSPQGTLLAFCEGRKEGSGLHGDVDLVLRRSFDGGKTWQPLQVVVDDGPNTVGNPCPVVDRDTGIIWLPFCRFLGSESIGAIVAGDSQESCQVWITHSTDDGATWSPPRNLTASVKDPDWGWYTTGPGVGIQLRAGRLVIPCYHIPITTEPTQQVHTAHVFYSDDHGGTWQLGGKVTRYAAATESDDPDRGWSVPGRTDEFEPEG